MPDEKRPNEADHIDETQRQEEARAHRRGGGPGLTLKEMPDGSTVKEQTPVETSLRGTEDTAPAKRSMQGSPD